MSPDITHSYAYTTWPRMIRNQVVLALEAIEHARPGRFDTEDQLIRARAKATAALEAIDQYEENPHV